MRDHAEPIPDEGTVAVAEVRLQAVTKTFGRQHVIQDLDLCINDGEFCVILGPSGCGKSTLLRLIAGLEEPTSGRICIGGTDVTNMPPKQRRAAMVFQSYALYPHMTAYGNMAFGLKLGRKRRDEVHRRVREAARILHIEDLLDRKPAQLSGGQQQRVAIGRAMVREPSVFLFDEPLSNLDSDLRGRMRTEFVNLHRRLRSTMVYVTHDQTEAMTLADRLVLVRDGVIVQTGSPMTLYRNPKSLFVAKFLGSPKMNLIPGRLVQSGPAHATVELVDGSRHRAAVAPTESAAGTAITLGVRPEALSLHGRGTNRLDGIVCMVEQLGDHVLVHVDWHATADTVIARGENGIVPRVGERVKLSFRPETCYLFSQNERAWPRNESTTTSEAGPSGSG